MKIGIGIVGGGYMGKAHAVAFQAVGAVFNTKLRPHLEMVCASTMSSAERYQAEYGFDRATDDWRALVRDPKVDAVVIASPQSTHCEIAIEAFAEGKPVLCEKPLGASLDDAKAMAGAAEASGVVSMVGFNYVRTPATQFVRKIIADSRIGTVNFFRGEHTEDFFADAEAKATWRSFGRENGAMGDLAPHMINCALALMGPIRELNASIETAYPVRGGVKVTNDDHAQLMVRFESGAQGHLYFSRIATGRKMGYGYDIYGSTGSIRFDQEDQNALWLYTREGPEAEQGYRKILTGPAHPDYLPFCQGPGHGTGYQDTIIIEAYHFLQAVEAGEARWPTFADGLAVSKVIEAAFTSNAEREWVSLSDFE